MEPSLGLNSNDPNTFPAELAETRNFDKLWLVFDNNCAIGTNTEDDIHLFVSQIKEQFTCLRDAQDATHKKNIYYNNHYDEWSVFLLIDSNNGNSPPPNNYPTCIDSANFIYYDDYCLSFIDYELIFSSQNVINKDIECETRDFDDYSSNNNSFSEYLWHLDLLDSIEADGLESYLNIDVLNGDADYVDIFVLDTGVLSTHDEFINAGINIIHGLESFGDEDIIKGHGTHMTGIIAGKNTGIIKSSGINIYEFPVCSRSATQTSCFWQDIWDGCEFVINILKEKNGLITNSNSTGDDNNSTFNIYHRSGNAAPHRGVINLSFGGYLPSWWLENNYDFLFGWFDEIYENGGILIGAGGNVQLNNVYYNPCQYWPAAASDNIISIGGYDNDFNVVSGSNTGDCIDIYAPGKLIYSAWNSGNSDYKLQTGTSAATAIVSGIVTQILMINPYLSLEQIRYILNKYSEDNLLGACESRIEEEEEDDIDYNYNNTIAPLELELECGGLVIDCDNLIYEALNPKFFGENVRNEENMCNFNPCECEGDYEVNSIDNCNICHDNSGCSQCKYGYFKIDYDFPCMDCQVVFGDNCQGCQDFVGCQQCNSGSSRMFDSDSYLWYCDNPFDV